MGNVTTEDVRHVVREELRGSAEIANLKTDVAEMKMDVRDLGIKFEHFDAKMDAIAELVTTTVKTRSEVASLRPRVEALEELAQVQKRVIADHSLALRELKK